MKFNWYLFENFLATDKIQTDKKIGILGKLINKLINFQSEKKKLITPQTDIFSNFSTITDKVKKLAEPKNW